MLATLATSKGGLESPTVLERFFANYRLIQSGLEMFVPEQSKLLSPDLIAISTDPRGTFTCKGIDAYFESLKDWFRYYRSGPDLRTEIVQATPMHALVRLHADMSLLKRVNGKTLSKEGGHDWTAECEVSPDGLITKLRVSLILH
jgi:hypothetical protein